MAGDGFGSFTPVAIPSQSSFEDGGAVAAADFTYDGHPDVAVGGKRVTLVGGDGAGAFGIFGGTFDIGGTTSGMATADFDSDGHADLAAVIPGSDVVTVLLGRPAAPGADLSVSVDVAPEPAVPHTPLVFTSTVTNHGPLAATGVRLTFQHPAGAPFISSVPGRPTCVDEPNSAGFAVLTCTLGDLAPGAQSVVTLTTDVIQDGATLASHVNSVAVAPQDNDPLNNDILLTTNVGAPADVSVTLTDAVDPVAPGGSFSFDISIENAGPNPVPETFVSLDLPDVLEPLFASNPSCSLAIHPVLCWVYDLGAGQKASFTVGGTAGTFTSVVSTAHISAAGDTQLANDTDSEETRGLIPVDRELHHGSELQDRFDPGLGSRLYYLVQQPFSSYEVVVDALSGKVAPPGQPLGLERLAVDMTVAQSGVAQGTGPSRALRFENTTSATVVSAVRVTSTGCGTACGADDAYRIRAWETTGRAARFNNTVGQRTVLLLQNPGGNTTTGHVWLWDEAGQPVGGSPVSVSPRETLRVELIALAPGRKGTLTVTHDAGYGGLVGKSVGLDVATGFTFDTPMEVRQK